MKKMYGILILASSLLLITGCQKTQETNKNINIITCQKYCDKGWKDDIQEQCYQNCKEMTKGTLSKTDEKRTAQTQPAINTRDSLDITGCKNICSATYGKAGNLTGEGECNDYCETALNPTSSCATIEKSGYIITTGLCIQQKAIEAQDPNYCENIDTAGERDICYLELSRSSMDKTICDRIQDAPTQEYCKQQNG